MPDINTFKLLTGNAMEGVTLTIRMPRSSTIRTKVACWLLGLAGRVMAVPCRIDLVHDDEEI